MSAMDPMATSPNIQVMFVEPMYIVIVPWFLMMMSFVVSMFMLILIRKNRGDDRHGGNSDDHFHYSIHDELSKIKLTFN
jgi:hypothetical protein